MVNHAGNPGDNVKETRWVDDFSQAWANEYPDVEETSGLLLIARLARLSVLIEAFQAETLREFDLVPSDYSVLAALRRSGPPYEITPTELHTALDRSSGGMTKMIKRLESLGLVSREPDPRDKRSNLVRLTEKGQEVEQQAFEAFVAHTHSLLLGTPADKLTTINDAVHDLLEIIEDGFKR